MSPGWEGNEEVRMQIFISQESLYSALNNIWPHKDPSLEEWNNGTMEYWVLETDHEIFISF